MALLCNDCECRGKKKQIWCNHMDGPCLFIRYCSVSGKYYQTDAAAKCKMKGQANGKEQNKSQTG